MPPVQDESFVVESVRFPSGQYSLEGELAYPEQREVLAVAVLAGPHPLLGGTMQNNVVAAVSRDLAHRGLATLRFNYRGTGGSEGPTVDILGRLTEFWKTSHVGDESDYQQDVNSACEFLQTAASDVPLVRIGYSFGCSLLSSEIRNPGPMVLIAPLSALTITMRSDHWPVRCF